MAGECRLIVSIRRQQSRELMSPIGKVWRQGSHRGQAQHSGQLGQIPFRPRDSSRMTPKLSRTRYITSFINPIEPITFIIQQEKGSFSQSFVFFKKKCTPKGQGFTKRSECNNLKKRVWRQLPGTRNGSFHWGFSHRSLSWPLTLVQYPEVEHTSVLQVTSWQSAHPSAFL